MKYFALCLLLLSYSVVAGQSADSLMQFSSEWRSIEAHSRQTTIVGMYVLSGWAIGNLVVNSVLSRNASGADKYFYQMNTIWNVVNLGLAGTSLYQNMLGNAAPTDWLTAYNDHHTIEKIFLVNTALDIAYVAGGLYMIEKSKNTTRQADRLNGFGKGVIVQGAFLFAFDLVMYFYHHGAQKEWARILQYVNLGPEGVGMVVPLR